MLLWTAIAVTVLNFHIIPSIADTCNSVVYGNPQPGHVDYLRFKTKPNEEELTSAKAPRFFAETAFLSPRFNPLKNLFTNRPILQLPLVWRFRRS